MELGGLTVTFVSIANNCVLLMLCLLALGVYSGAKWHHILIDIAFTLLYVNPVHFYTYVDLPLSFVPKMQNMLRVN